jgi:Tc toxin complex TcA C-terminal TcB-binding domain/ABC toxin N-terminal region/Neuraminidase-like domain/Salmonella virulence plasmid 28.1kDa A protein
MILVEDVALRIHIRNPLGNFLGGTVDIEFKNLPMRETSVEHTLDASKEIAVSGLHRAPNGDYQVTITPGRGLQPQTQSVTIPATGFATLDLVFATTPAATARQVETVTGRQPAVQMPSVLPSVQPQAPPQTSAQPPTRTQPPVQTVQTGPQVPSQTQPPPPPGGNVTLNPTQPSQIVVPPIVTIPLVVHGQVTWEDGRPVTGATVQALDQDLRGQETLGQAQTDVQGSYTIQYTTAQFTRAEKTSADLVVRVLNAAGTAIATSPTAFNAPPDATINIVVPQTAAGTASEYERLTAELQPLLVNVVITSAAPPTLIDQLADLKDDDLDFLTNETGIERQKLSFLTTGAVLEKKAAAAHLSIPTAAFYGLAREGLPADLAALGSLSQTRRSDALTKALDDNLIPAVLSRSLPTILAGLQQLATSEALQTPPAPGKTAIGQLLGMVLTAQADQAAFLAAYADNEDQPIEDFWKNLRAQPQFAPKVDAVQLTLQLGLLTQGHLPLIQELQSSVKPSSPRDLVQLDSAAWTAMVNKPNIGVPPDVPGTTPEERTTNYVNGIMGLVHAAFPTETVAHIVATAPNTNIDDATRQAVSTFFANAPDLDLRSTRIDDYIATNASTVFNGIAAADQPNVRAQVKRLQRLFQVSTNADTMTALLGTGLDSALAIARYPRTSFVAQFQSSLGGENQADAVYDRAVALNARTVQMYALINDALNGVSPLAIAGTSKGHEAKAAPKGANLAGGGSPGGGTSNGIEAAVAKAIPNYADLFGGLDMCECGECRSVLGAAAYFVDLLEFLRHSTPNTQNKTPLDVLLGRRPDLANLPLTCENTNTTLPYVDLVNEVLESYVTYLVSLEPGNQAQDPSIPAFDTGDATAQELDANPQNTNEDAYKELSQAVYPFTLPFNQPVAVARAYLEHLGSSRYEVLDVFRKDDADATLQAINREYLEITEEEHQVLLGNNVDGSGAPVRQFYGYSTDDVTRTVNGVNTIKKWNDWLADVPELLRRTGTLYADLVELLKTRFINPLYPQGDDLDLFLRIPFDYPTLLSLAPQFSNLTADQVKALDEAKVTSPDLVGWWDRNSQIGQLIVLDAPSGSDCDLTNTRLQHLDGTLLVDSELSKMDRFIRLWRKLGWSLADLDRALAALQASNIDDVSLNQLALIKQLQDDLNLSNLQVLLSFWASIDTHGDDSLYKKLFLSKAAQRIDDAFRALPDGTVLPAVKGLKVADHLPAILAALRVSASDLDAIRADANLLDPVPPTPPTVPLDLPTVSTLYRYAALAKTLRLRVSDFIALKIISGINPFASVDQTLQFVAAARKVQQSAFKVVHLNYLYRHLTAPPTNLAPQPAALRLMAKTLRDGLVKISQDNVLVPDPSGEVARAKLALLFDSAVVTAAIGMIDGSAVNAAPLSVLPPNTVFPDTVKKKTSHDANAHMLRFQGGMTIAEQGALLGASADASYQAAVNNLFQQPANFIQNALSGFLDPQDAEKKLLRDTPSLDQDLAPVLLDAQNQPTTDEAAAVQTAVAAKFEYLLTYLLPYVKDQLSHSLVKQTIATALKLDAALAQVLLEVVLKSPADSAQNAISDLLALVTPGLTASYFASSDLTGVASVQTVETVSGSVPGASARWRGTLIAPNNGDFTFSVTSTGVSQLWLGLPGQPLQVVSSASVTLKAGQLYDLLLEVTQLPQLGTTVELRWQSATVPQAIIPGDNLLPGSILDNFGLTYTRLQKAALVANSFALSDGEVSYLSDLKHSGDFDNFDLNLLPLLRDDTTAAQIDQQQAPGQFKWWLRLSDLVTLRNSLPRGEVSLVDVFGVAAIPNATLDDVEPKVVQATAWDAVVLEALTSAQGFNLSAADFVSERALLRLQDGVALVRRFGVAGAKLFDWAALGVTFDQLAAVAQDIREAVHAKYDEDTWLAVAKPLNDILRQSQRDALVAYLLPRLDLDAPNRLFEFFLIDVEMGACMETSRIKQAISSVQLFVQRCLVNLESILDPNGQEAGVSPSAISSEQWEWMKHYRVWEANREVFLYPENWIEPELRDDKSPFFKELESELLQNNLTNDAVETALMNYLAKLDQVARLEICGMYFQDVDPDTNQPVNILHVFGRTLHTPRAYYYRQLIDNATWTAWEQVPLDIEGDHLIPVVWNGRLYLFWPSYVQKTDPPDTSQPIDASKPIKLQQASLYWEARLAWSEHYQGAWTSKQLSNAVLRCEDLTTGLDVIVMGDQLSIAFLSSGGGWDITSIYIPGGLNSPGHDINHSILEINLIGDFIFTGSEAAIATEDTSGQTVGYDDAVTFFLSSSSLKFERATPAGDNTWLGDILLNLPSGSVQVATISGPCRIGQPFFCQDDMHTFLVTQEETNGSIVQMTNPIRATPGNQAGLLTYLQWTGGIEDLKDTAGFGLKFICHYHPYVCQFIKSLNLGGIAGLLSLENQSQEEKTPTFPLYKPSNYVEKPFPKEIVDFSEGGAYSLYNWELFFHAPLLIATRLSKNQRFSEARSWFHYVFNPTDDTQNDLPPARYWQVLPFRSIEPERIDQLLTLLATPDQDIQNSDDLATKESLTKQWNQLKANPFQPHLIARLRITPYQKDVFMKYVDNLIAWGDQLFRQDTIEAINEATQYYVLAADLLGPRPQQLPQRGKLAPQTYTDLKPRLDAFSNALAEIENAFPFSGGVSGGQSGEGDGLLGVGPTLYFCIPQNDKLLGYWDTVADRLFKIRNCMNIEGVVRQLPLFEPPIDPALLVQAAAQGVDLNSVLNDLNAPLPYYRFSYMLQKALELCAEVRSLGGALLSALEKKDAEDLGLLRASHETNILNMMATVKSAQVDEAQSQIDALRQSQANAAIDYIASQTLLGEKSPAVPGWDQQISLLPISTHPAQGAEGGLPLSEGEQSELDLSHDARDQQHQAFTIDQVAGQIANFLADFELAAKPMGCGNALTTGLRNVVGVMNAVAAQKRDNSAESTYEASHAGKLAGYARRQEEWTRQSNRAAGEFMQIGKQIAGANIRLTIASQELAVHRQQMQDAQDVQDYLSTKFTNQDLYSWMIADIAATYFQCYQMAYDLAKKAERAFRFERGLTESNFIQFGYWDSLQKGLLAGERLYLALKQMERAYHDQNKREYEITKDVSLVLHDPMALIALKETGRCEIELPEMLFDADYPGHYMRRIKSVSITLPCVVGPYTSINCTLTLLTNKTRITSLAGSQYEEDTDNGDNRFVTNFAALQSIATSHAQNDSGLFELNFRDERYLPFEGAGAVSRWRIDLPSETNAFDLNSLTDVVLHLKYTAREGGDILKNKAKVAMQAAISDTDGAPLMRLFSSRHEFPDEWYRFLHPSDQTATSQTMVLDLSMERFPYLFRGTTLTITKVDAFLTFRDAASITDYAKGSSLPITLTSEGNPVGTPKTTLASDPALFGGTPHSQVDGVDLNPPTDLTVVVDEKDIGSIAPQLWETVPPTGPGHTRLRADAIDDMLFVVHYAVG